MFFLPLLMTACSLNGESLPRFENVDLLGSTLESKVLPSESRCAQWCQEVDECDGYTYGGSGLEPRYKNRCYLKRAGFRFKRTKGFNSAIKK